MRKVINRRLYDTETAERLAYWDNDLPASDFRSQEEALYRTKHGALFIHGRGGPLSDYAVPVGNNGRGGGEDIRPVSQEEAIDWLEMRQLTDELIELFPDAVSDA